MKKRVVFVSMAAAALLTACGGTQKSETTTAQTTVQTTAGQSTEAQTAAVSAENTSSTQTVDKQKVYVSAEWVKSVIDGKQPESSDYKIIEVAWGKESDDKAYTKGHIPGHIISIQTILSQIRIGIFVHQKKLESFWLVMALQRIRQ